MSTDYILLLIVYFGPRRWCWCQQGELLAAIWNGYSLANEGRVAAQIILSFIRCWPVTLMLRLCIIFQRWRLRLGSRYDVLNRWDFELLGPGWVAQRWTSASRYLVSKHVTWADELSRVLQHLLLLILIMTARQGFQAQYSQVAQVSICFMLELMHRCLAINVSFVYFVTTELLTGIDFHFIHERFWVETLPTMTEWPGRLTWCLGRHLSFDLPFTALTRKRRPHLASFHSLFWSIA